MRYTHKGWFFMCPIYLNLDDASCPRVDARHRYIEWWFAVNEAIFAAVAFLMTAMSQEFEPEFPFMITGEVDIEVR